MPIELKGDAPTHLIVDGHAARVQRQDPLVEAREAGLALLHQLGLEGAVAIARHFDFEIALVGSPGLAVGAVPRGRYPAAFESSAQQSRGQCASD